MADDGYRGGYEYKSTSNLVLNVDSRTRGEIGPSSDVQSLAGRKSVHQMQREMGARAAQTRTAAEGARPGGGTRQRRPGGADDGSGDSAPKRAKVSRDGPSSSFTSLPSASSSSLSSSSSSQLYRPQTKETRLVYDSLLSFLPSLLPTLSSHDVLTSAADELLLLLKDPSLTAKAAQAEAEALLGVRVADEKWRTLVNIAKRITDWVGEGGKGDEDKDRGEAGRDGKGAGEGGEVDDRVGVSVVFNEDDDEEEEEKEDDEELDVIKDEESDEADDGDDDRIDVDDDAAAASAVLHSKDAAVVKDEDDDAIDDDDAIPTLDASKPSASTASSSSSSLLDPRAIDAHWIQRQIGGFTPDAITSQSLSSQVFASMADASLSDGAVETSLVGLLGFDHFALIKTLMTNRWRLVYAIRLARAADEAERDSVLREMRDNERAKGVYEELTGKASSTAHPAPMDVDSSVSSLPSASGSQPLPAASKGSKRKGDAYWVQHPKSLLDLESLTFTAGSHQMSNADCKLPKVSTLVAPLLRGSACQPASVVGDSRASPGVLCPGDVCRALRSSPRRTTRRCTSPRRARCPWPRTSGWCAWTRCRPGRSRPSRA